MVTSLLVLLRGISLLRVLHRTLTVVTTLLLRIASITLLLGWISLLVVTSLRLAAVILVCGAGTRTRRVLLEVAGVGRMLVGRWRARLLEGQYDAGYREKSILVERIGD